MDHSVAVARREGELTMKFSYSARPYDTLLGY